MTVGPVKVGNLASFNRDTYPGLGDWFVQLRIGPTNDEVLARVYGDSPEQAYERAKLLADALSPSVDELLAAPVVQGEPVAYLRIDQLNHVQRMGPMVGEIADSPRADRVAVYVAPQPAEQKPVDRLEEELAAAQAECEKLRKDAERYRYIKRGRNWIVAATQTGVQLDGEELDDLIDSEMEQQT